VAVVVATPPELPPFRLLWDASEHTSGAVPTAMPEHALRPGREVLWLDVRPGPRLPALSSAISLQY